jgi:hypothetical protein
MGRVLLAGTLPEVPAWIPFRTAPMAFARTLIRQPHEEPRIISRFRRTARIEHPALIGAGWPVLRPVGSDGVPGPGGVAGQPG